MKVRPVVPPLLIACCLTYTLLAQGKPAQPVKQVPIKPAPQIDSSALKADLNLKAVRTGEALNRSRESRLSKP